MNTNELKRFAKEARIKLVDQVGRKLAYVLSNTEPVFLDSYAAEIKSLQGKIRDIGKDQVIDTVAYTWFNRLMALRFMDANGYTSPKVVTPTMGKSPEILQNALAGQLDDSLKINRQRLNDLLDGKVVIADSHAEAYRMLLVSSCNKWHAAMPFMFERISDFTELLLPDDLLSDYSIVTDILNGMSEENCQQEEIIGWLYQFYISEENERLIKSKSVYKKHELAPASQLFTPKWIVKYMVDNTLGQLWSEINPKTSILPKLEFYIKPADKEQLQKRPKKKLEEIKLFEPCVGSGHILSYAFDVFYLMYEEQGYNTTEIPELIIKYNLFGIDIDERASQIASFVLIMKGRRKYNRILHKNIIPNITFYEDFEGDTKFSNCKALGSLINVEPNEIGVRNVSKGPIFADRQNKLNQLYTFLGQRYDCVVTNPPYISSSRMEGSVKAFVEANYPETKSDLFATFIIRCLALSNEDGLTGYMTPFVWMFISSYQRLREIIIDNHFINNLIQLEYSGFEGATVPICTFTIRNNSIKDSKGSYVRLSDFKGSENQAPKVLQAIQNTACGWFYLANQFTFKRIPEARLGYWLTEKVLYSFQNSKLQSYAKVLIGMKTGDNTLFLKKWHEVSYNLIGLNLKTLSEANKSTFKWFPYIKGGDFRKWYGNFELVLNWHDEGKTILAHKNLNGIADARIRPSNFKYYFTPGVTWSRISSGKLGARLTPIGFFFDCNSPSLFSNTISLQCIIGFLSSKVSVELLRVLSPTLTFQIGDIKLLPIIENDVVTNEQINSLVNECVDISKRDWDSREISWNFEGNALISHKDSIIKYEIDKLCNTWKDNFYAMHRKEVQLNQFFIDSYGLEGEINSNLPLDEITIQLEESRVINNELVFDYKNILIQLSSYIVGCIFGRYSINKPGLILANQGETFQDFLTQVSNPTFLPNMDGIIPILESEWFADDIVGRYKAFLKAAFGGEKFEENLKYIEDTIGKDIRKYFVKDFYNDHIKRYKMRPIYWMFSSPKGHFKALIYTHRYQPDLCSKMLTEYLQSFIHKLEGTKQNKVSESLREDLPARERTAANKEADRYEVMIKDCKEYAQTLYAVATKKIEIDLDDGVKVNYQKFKEVLLPIKGLEKDEE